MAKTKKQKHKITMISRVILILVTLISIIFFGMLLSTGLLPTKYILLVLIPYFLCLIIGGIFQWKQSIKSGIKWFLNIISIIFIVVLSLGISYMYKTFDFMGKIGAKGYQTEEFYLLTLKDSKINLLNDLKNDTVGFYPVEQDSYINALKDMKSKLSATYKEYQVFDKLGQDLLDEKIPAIFVSATQKDTLSEEVEGFESKIKTISTSTQKVKTEIVTKEANVTDEPFNIYISGIDIYGNITSVSRSDVNMIVTVNPKTHKILLTSIPRDYYVQLHGKTGYKDKLTHAGVYGIDMSIQTLEDLLAVDINYYIRVNFTTLINLVDAIGGINVYSDKTLTPYTNSSCKVIQGNNHFNGACALAFSRERHAYTEGDRHRVKNQQDVLSAILKKTLSSKTLVTKYTKILESFGSSFQTNMGSSKIYSLVNMQLDSMPNWTIENYSVDGTGASELTYSYPHQKLYVMVPNQTTVTTAKAKIDAIEKGE